MKFLPALVLICLLVTACEEKPPLVIPTETSLNAAAVLIAADVISDDVYSAEVTDSLVRVKIEMSPGITSTYHVRYTEEDIKDIICALRESGRYPGRQIMVEAMIELVDQFGNPIESEAGLAVTVDNDVIMRLNCADSTAMVGVVLENIAAQYVVHRLLK